MELYGNYMLGAMGVAAVMIGIGLFLGPIRKIIKFLLNSLLGLLILLIINYVGKYIGVTIALNWITILTTGILGIPGIAALLLLKLIFGV
ncbi:MAG: pro-sigmaK processing inhibitor BofA family protein [Bacillota bacterium]|nr:pro-sigmaK processing inhibitor BofA family protein [Bacillota bacterium]